MQQQPGVERDGPLATEYHRVALELGQRVAEHRGQPVLARDCEEHGHQRRDVEGRGQLDGVVLGERQQSGGRDIEGLRPRAAQAEEHRRSEGPVDHTDEELEAARVLLLHEEARGREPLDHGRGRGLELLQGQAQLHRADRALVHDPRAPRLEHEGRPQPSGRVPHVGR